MSIKIHHGPNGSYKTSGAIQDDAIPALKAGRVVVTNIRGFTLERAYQEFPNLPDTTEIINLSLESLEDMERMRNWFTWVPRGAFVIFDETQIVFPKAWRDADLKKFDFPGGPEAAAAADRPMGWLDAWTRHRHFNWDVVLTTPNIAYIRDDIRMTCEMAYRHSNLAVIGIPGRYKEAQHDAQVNKPPMEGTVIEYKKIRQQTFRLYQSTATGAHHDTKAGKSLLRSPKLLFLLAFIAACLLFVLSMGPLSFFGGRDIPKPVPAAASTPGAAPAAPSAGVPVADQPSSGPNSLVSALHVGDGSDDAPVVLEHPFGDRRISILAHAYMPSKGDLYMFALEDGDGRHLELSSWQLLGSGYHVTPRGECVADIEYKDWKGTVTCAGSNRQKAVAAGMERQGMQAATAVPSVPQSSVVPVTVVSDNSRLPRTL